MSQLAFRTHQALALLLTQVDRLGGWLTLSDVMRRCGFDQSEFVARHNNNALLIMHYGGGVFCPAFQFHGNDINPHIPTLLTALSMEVNFAT